MTPILRKCSLTTGESRAGRPSGSAPTAHRAQCNGRARHQNAGPHTRRHVECRHLCLLILSQKFGSKFGYRMGYTPKFTWYRRSCPSVAILSRGVRVTVGHVVI